MRTSTSYPIVLIFYSALQSSGVGISTVLMGG